MATDAAQGRVPDERDFDLIEVALNAAAQSMQSGADLRNKRNLDPLAAEYLHALRAVEQWRKAVQMVTATAAMALTDDEKQALSITLKFRIDQLKAIEAKGNAVAPRAREQIDHLVSAATKLALP